MLSSITGTEGVLGGVAAVVAIVGGVGYVLKIYIRQVMSEIKPNGGNKDNAGDVLLRAGTAIGEIQATLDRHVAADEKTQQELHDAVLILTRRTLWHRRP